MTPSGKNSPLFISLIPHLMKGEGHIIPYHQAVGKAVHSLGWEHLVLLPQNSPDHLFSQQEPCLWDADLEAEGTAIAKLLRIQDILTLANSIAKFFKERPGLETRPKIIFIERFIHLQLLALALALWLMPSENLRVWIFYRRDVHKDKTRGFYKWLNQSIKQRVGATNCKFLTDSEPLQKALEDYFQEDLTVMPIPHTEITCPDVLTVQKQPEEILCWWAGSPREEKGWEIMRKLLSSPVTTNREITLVAAESSQLNSHPQGFKLKLIADQLSREEYNQWLWLSDIILIPYDSKAYQERTSGIFTESIIAGKIPLVTPNTWMAQCLTQYDLTDLILTWEDSQQVGDRTLQILEDDNIKKNLTKMQKKFQAFHQETTYANLLRTLF